MDPYRVPFLFDRTAAPRYRLVNVSGERLRGVTVSLLGPGIMPATSPQTLEATEALDLHVRGEDLARATLLVIRWLRPTGEDYLWRVSF